MTAREFRTLRRLSGLTQERAAQVLEVSHRTVLRWEHGESHIRPLLESSIRGKLTPLVFKSLPITEPKQAGEVEAKGGY